MSETKWTPGPYYTYQVGNGTWVIRAESGEEVGFVRGSAYEVRAEANALLFKAAPDLYEALMRVHEFIANGLIYGYIQMPEAGTPDSAHQVPRLVLAALALARGETDGGET